MNIFRGYIHFIVQWTLCWAEDFAFCGIQDETKAETLDKFLASRVRSLIQFSSVHSVMSNSLRPRGLKHARPPCPSPAPGAYSNSCPSSPWWHPNCPLLLLPSIFPCIWVFSKESVLHIRWPNYWSFSFSIRPSNEHSGLISFRMDWLDILAAQGTLKSLLQHHTSKASIFSAQLSL